MTLNIKNREVDKLLQEVVQMTGESKTEAVRRALEERQHRLSLRLVAQPKEKRIYAFLQDEIWANIPDNLLGTTLTKEEEDDILGYGEWGI